MQVSSRNDQQHHSHAETNSPFEIIITPDGLISGAHSGRILPDKTPSRHDIIFIGNSSSGMLSDHSNDIELRLPVDTFDFPKQQRRQSQTEGKQSKWYDFSRQQLGAGESSSFNNNNNNNNNNNKSKNTVSQLSKDVPPDATIVYMGRKHKAKDVLLVQCSKSFRKKKKKSMKHNEFMHSEEEQSPNTLRRNLQHIVSQSQSETALLAKRKSSQLNMSFAHLLMSSSMRDLDVSKESHFSRTSHASHYSTNNSASNVYIQRAFQELEFSDGDLQALANDKTYCRKIRTSLVSHGVVTNGFLKQNMHFYIRKHRLQLEERDRLM